MIQAGCWLPLLPLAERCARERRLRYAAAAGGVLALMVLAGHRRFCSALAATGVVAASRHSPDAGLWRGCGLRWALLLMGSVAGAPPPARSCPPWVIARTARAFAARATELFPLAGGPPRSAYSLLRGNPRSSSFEVAQSAPSSGKAASTSAWWRCSRPPWASELSAAAGARRRAASAWWRSPGWGLGRSVSAGLASAPGMRPLRCVLLVVQLAPRCWRLRADTLRARP